MDTDHKDVPRKSQEDGSDGGGNEGQGQIDSLGVKQAKRAQCSHWKKE